MLSFSDINENQEETERVTENVISDGKEMNKNNNEMQLKQNILQLKIPETCTELQQMRPL